MRIDETGASCPETLGEYYDLIVSLFGKDNKASKFLEEKIKTSSKKRHEKVIAPDSQMRMLLITIAMKPKELPDIKLSYKKIVADIQEKQLADKRITTSVSLPIQLSKDLMRVCMKNKIHFSTVFKEFAEEFIRQMEEK